MDTFDREFQAAQMVKVVAKDQKLSHMKLRYIKACNTNSNTSSSSMLGDLMPMGYIAWATADREPGDARYG